MSAHVNERPILRGNVHLPAEGGAWTAHVVLEGEDDLPAGPREVRVVLPGDLELVGTVRRQGTFAATFSAELAGGAGGLASRGVAAKFYRQVPLRIPLLDVLSEAGELLAASSEAELLSMHLPSWSRVRGPAAHALRELLTAAGATWRVLPDGTVWIGRTAWPLQELDDDLLEDDPSMGLMTIAVDDAALLPPVTFRGRRIQHAVYRFDGPKLRLEAWS